MKHYLHYVLLLVCLSFLSSVVRAQNAYITNYADTFVSVINTATQATVATIPVQYGGQGVVVSPDGTRAYIGYEYTGVSDNKITVINTATNTVASEVLINNEGSSGGIVEISPDGSRLYASSDDSLFVINTQTLQVIKRLSIGDGEYIYSIAASPDGKAAYISGESDIYVLNTTTNSVSDTITLADAGFFQLLVSADSKTLYGADDFTGSLQIINIATQSATAVSTTTGDVIGLALSPDGSTIYMTNASDNTVSVIALSTATVTSTIDVGASPWGISITPDGKQVYVANLDDNNVSVINTTTNSVIKTITVGQVPLAYGRFIVGKGILPVKLAGFTAALQGNDAQLKWQTASEINTSSFRVERSTDGIHFTTIGTVAATGGSNLQGYVYNDKNIANLLTAKTAYYRLQMVDRDGSAVASGVVPVALRARLAAVLLLPNPVKNTLTVQVSGHEGSASFIVTDMSGKRMLAVQATVAEGSTVSINTSALASGTYILRMEAKDGVVKEKFVKE